jgi:hypothetical protein
MKIRVHAFWVSPAGGGELEPLADRFNRMLGRFPNWSVRSDEETNFDTPATQFVTMFYSTILYLLLDR